MMMMMMMKILTVYGVLLTIHIAQLLVLGSINSDRLIDTMKDKKKM